MKVLRRFSALAPPAILLLAACDQPTQVANRDGRTPPGQSASVSHSQGSKRWLPVGTIVPVGDTIDAPPEPYNPARHGAALKSTVEFENLAGKPGFERQPKRRDLKQANLTPPPSEGDRGFYWLPNTRPWFGASAMYDLNLNLQLPTPWGGHDMYVYAPTMMPPGGSCVEVTQVYRRLSGGATTGKLFGIFDWCESGSGAFDVLEAQVTSWTDRYVRTYQGKPMYAVTIVTPNDGSTMGSCWYANMYDYLLGGWVERLARCGTPVHEAQSIGWTMWESWWLTNGACPTLPSIRSLDIMLLDPITGQAIPFTDSLDDINQLGPTGIACWVSGPYTFSWPVPGQSYNSWRGNTPNP